MDSEYLIQELNNIENAKRDNRQRVANIVSERPELIAPLVKTIFSILSFFIE